MLLGVFWVIDHRKGQNVIRTSITQSPNGSFAKFLFLPHFDVICQLLERFRFWEENKYEI